MTLLLVGEISNHGWNVSYMFIGAAVGIVGTVLMVIWQEVLDERKANEDAARRRHPSRLDSDTDKAQQNRHG